MKYVYILESLDSQHFYVGITDDLRARLKKHNAGEVPHTSKYGPWQIKTVLSHSAMRLKRSHSKNTCPPPAGPSPKSASDRVLLPQRRIQLVTQRNQIVFHRR